MELMVSNGPDNGLEQRIRRWIPSIPREAYLGSMACNKAFGSVETSSGLKPNGASKGMSRIVSYGLAYLHEEDCLNKGGSQTLVLPFSRKNYESLDRDMMGGR